MNTYDGLALFSGGLDSILAARLLMQQGKRIQCLHFTSPFFGDASLVPKWEKLYGLSITPVNIDDVFVSMLLQKPEHGFGSVMNPCVDCKILMMRQAKALLPEYGAKFLVSGEVLGQRPMSQRRDTLNIIKRDGDVRDLLIRPLCALHLDPTPWEISGEIDRSRLLGISGRGRKEQLALAEEFGIKEIPAPAGGCMLTEKENARRYWPIVERLAHPTARDFHLANVGRQFWRENFWLSIGRHKADNDAIPPLVTSADYLFKVAGFPGPLAVGRADSEWPLEILQDAAASVASYSPKAVQATTAGTTVTVRITHGGEQSELSVTPARSEKFSERGWKEVVETLHALRKKKAD